MIEVCNVKLSLKLSWEGSFNTDGVPPFKDSIHAKTYQNFWVFKTINYTFIIFKAKDKVHHVNLTKVRQLGDVSDARASLLASFTVPPSVIKEPVVDNLTCLSRTHHNLDLFHIHQSALARPLESLTSIRFNLEQFPGLILKFKNPKACCLIFSSGKIVIVGCRTLIDVETILKGRTHGTGLLSFLSR